MKQHLILSLNRIRTALIAVTLLLVPVFQMVLASPVHADDNFSASYTSSPAMPTTDTTPTFEFTTTYDTSAFTFRCYIDNLSIGDCTSPYTVSTLEPGEHTFYVGLRDNFGNFSPVNHHTWTINTLEQGDGSPEYPLALTDCQGLQDMEIFKAFSFKLANDIDCDGFTYTPIAHDYYDPFTGSLDGQGYTVSNITTSGFNSCGIFENIQDATIENLHIDSMNNNCQGSYQGQVAAFAIGGTIQDVVATNGNITDGGSNVGGLVGGALGTEAAFIIDRSSSDANISGGIRVGGLVGGSQTNLAISNSYASGNVYGKTIGGLVGEINSGSLSMTSSYTSNSLHNTTSNPDFKGLTGGLVGFGALNIDIIDSFSAADMASNDPDLSDIGGIFGLYGSGELSTIGLYIDANRSGTFVCDKEGDANCTAKTNSDYFLKDKAVSDPMRMWGNWWNMNEDNEYPSFTIGQPMCNTHTPQATSINFRCQFLREQKHHYSGTDVSNEYRYRIFGSNDAWQYGAATIDGYVNIPDLQSATPYDVQVHANWEIGHTDWAASGNTYTTAPGPDYDFDGDGIPDLIEQAGPNSGDANGDYLDDGIIISGLDRDQGNVSSFLNTATGKYTVLESNCTRNRNVAFASESTDQKDAGYDFGLGLISFTATGCGPTATFTQYYYGSYDASKFVARKFNTATKSYTTIPGAVLSNVVINGQPVLKIVYQIADNGPLDEDATVGTIKDPSGPASAAVSVPNTGLKRK